MVDVGGHVLTCFDANRSHSLSHDPGVGIKSIEVYSELPMGARTVNIVIVRAR